MGEDVNKPCLTASSTMTLAFGLWAVIPLDQGGSAACAETKHRFPGNEIVLKIKLSTFPLACSPEHSTDNNSLCFSFPPQLSTTRRIIERPMKIEIIVDPARPLSLASRVAPAVTASATNGAQAPRLVSCL